LSYTNTVQSLLSALKENMLEVILMADDGSYADGQGKRKLLPEVVFKLIGEMVIGQKVLILETENGIDEEDHHEEGEKEVCI
jgi:hypothetical protein